MKRLIVIGVVALMVLSIGTFATAQGDPVETEKTINVTLNMGDVPLVFGMEIWPEQYNQTLYPGVLDQDLGTLTIYPTAYLNEGEQWYISTSSPDGGCPLTSPVITPPPTAPLVITTEGLGQYIPPGDETWRKPPEGVGVKDQPITPTALPIYTSAANEYNTKTPPHKMPVIEVQFNVPGNKVGTLQPGGIYEGTIELTMSQ